MTYGQSMFKTARIKQETYFYWCLTVTSSTDRDSTVALTNRLIIHSATYRYDWLLYERFRVVGLLVLGLVGRAAQPEVVTVH